MVYLPNLFGVCISIGCIYAFEMNNTASNLTMYVVVCLISFFASACAFFEDATSLGYIGCVLAAALMGAPLATMGTVIREKSTASLPLNPSIMSFFNSVSWSLYGILIAHDFLVSLIFALILMEIDVLIGFLLLIF